MLLFVPATEIVPTQALSALMGIGLKLANSWSLRAAEKRTTLLLIWDKEEITSPGNLRCRRNRGSGRQRNKTQSDRRTTTPPPPVHLQPASQPLPGVAALPAAQKSSISAVELEKDLEVSSTSDEEQESHFIQPKKIVRMPQKKKTKLMTSLCHELGLAKIMKDEKKAVNFINAVTYIGYRSLETPHPRRAQWHFGAQILPSYYYDIFEGRPISHLFDAAKYIGSLQDIEFPRVCVAE